MARKIEVTLTSEAYRAFVAACKRDDTPAHPARVAAALFEAGLASLTKPVAAPARVTLEASVEALETPSMSAAPRTRRGSSRRSGSSDPTT